MLFLPLSTYQSCSVGTANQCKDAEFAPGTNLAGEGFDITKMKRKGAYVIDMKPWKNKDNTCNLCANPYMEGKKQKLPLFVVDWRPNQVCSMKVSSQLHKSSESLISSSSSSVDNNWKINLDINVKGKSGSLMLAGTQSKLAEYSMEKTKSDKFSFTSQSMNCEYYSYRVSRSPKLHREFLKAVRKLPKTYSPENKQTYYKLIDDFGTHYITKVKLGGSVQSVTSIRQCQASLQGLSVEEVKMCLDVEASASIGDNNFKTEAKHCKKDIEKTESKSSFSSLFNDRFTEIKGGHTTEPELLFSADKDPSAYKNWLNSLLQNPDIVSYSLDSLHELLPDDAPVRKNLRSAISHYILEKALLRNCSDTCQAGRHNDHSDPCVCQCHNDPGVNADCCPTHKGIGRVIITVQRGTDLWGDYTTATDGYVKVFFDRLLIRRSPVILNNNNPHWNLVIDLGSQDLSAGKKVRFEVWDQDNNWDDDLLGECENALSAGVKEDLCNLQHGRLYYKWEVKCAPSLTGEACMDYKPSPMNHSLRAVYVSRHSRPVPRATLLSMGVFANK
ncbi:hypothetical protein LDENG_00279780 [Lucifuga dentata]|nr:hypothetical protein LDENG_00279780 [Lucifuga dentata]